ncbi:hypothetical protein J0H58_19500 [bacterium]|nr:hypothetical protein [bacterium]
MATCCSRCGATLPKLPARVCLSCYQRVEDLPLGTPLGSNLPPPALTWAAGGGALLLLVSFVLALRGLVVALTEPEGHPVVLLGLAVVLATGALYLFRRDANRGAA